MRRSSPAGVSNTDYFRPTSLQNVSISVPVDGAVTDMTSQPAGKWLEETRRAIWRFSDVSNVGSIRARFQLTDGPGSQGTIAAQVWSGKEKL